MPISENEVMCTRALPEEVEAEPRASASDAPTTEVRSTADAEDGATLAENEDAGAEETVVRVEGASRLEATLARLEMNSLQIKLHLDLLEERIGRIDPGLLPGPREAMPAPDRGAPGVASADVATSVVAERSVPEKAVPDSVAVERSVSAEPPPREARNDRWSHLMGPEVEARVPVFPAPLPADEKPAQEAPAALTPARELEPGPAGPEQRFAASVLAAEGTADVLPMRSVVPPVARQAPAEGRTDVPERPAPVAFPERRTEVDGIEAERRRPFRRVPAVEELPEDLDASDPGLWRGYRVRTLVLAALLLVLAAVPLAIWWRLSVEARDADAGDAAPTSQADPAAVAAPVGRTEGNPNRMRHTPPVRTSEGAVASLGNAGRVSRQCRPHTRQRGPHTRQCRPRH